MKFFFFIITLFVLLACKTSNLFIEPRVERKESILSLDSAFAYKKDYQYLIRKNDKLNISVWGQDELSVGSIYGVYSSNEVYGKWLLVDANGNVEIPKIGTKKVEGLSIIQLKDTLKSYFGVWVLNPIIDVKVMNKEITVMGEVRTPQTMVLDKERNNLLEVISRAGGFEFYANLKYVKVLRPFGDSVLVENVNLKKSGDLMNKNIQVYPGDIVIVPSKRNKEFDKRISTIVPFTSTVSSIAVLFGLLKK
jgi:polysaccharide export outer membrane protein